MSDTTLSTQSRSLRGWLVTGLLLLGLNLRGPFVVVSTVTAELHDDLGMSSTVIGLLTTLPVLCFGIATPGASAVIARLGIARSVLCTLLGVLLGVIVRSIGGIPAALLGTLILGLAITVGNVVSPMIIGRDFRGRAAMATGGYTAAMNIGSMITLSVTGPLVSAFGWQLGLAVWAGLPLIAGAVWLPLSRRPTGQEPPMPSARRERTGSSSLSAVLRRPATWLLTGAFAGQAFAYYGLTAWLPALLADVQGMTRDQAGAASSIFQVAAIVGAFGTPVLINRLGGPRTAFLVNGALWACLPLGLLFAPGLWPLWTALSGVAQGGGFVAIFTVVVWVARSLSENRQLGSVVQTGGYSVACLAPMVLGALHDAAGGWNGALVATLVGVLMLTVLGFLAAWRVRR